jgi:hypothetical protein
MKLATTVLQMMSSHGQLACVLGLLGDQQQGGTVDWP